jgi:hypothetical protein
LLGLAAFLGLAFWLWVLRPPLLPDLGGRLRREERGQKWQFLAAQGLPMAVYA